MVEIILEIIKYTLPAIVVFLTAYLMIRSFLNNDYKKLQMEIRLANRKDVLPVRLQAYERLALFVERISPSNLIGRVRQPDMNAKELQLTLISAIKQEYDHNLSQQIYVTPETWGTVSLVKDEIIKMINLISASLPSNASGRDLSKAIFEYLLNTEDALPTHHALNLIKAEVKKIY